MYVFYEVLHIRPLTLIDDRDFFLLTPTHLLVDNKIQKNETNLKKELNGVHNKKSVF